MWKLSFKGCICFEFWPPGCVFTSKCVVSIRLFFCLNVYSIDLYGAETWTIRAADQKHLESFEMCCWERMEISWIDRLINDEVLLRVKEQRNILHERIKRKAKWMGHISCRNCPLQWVIEGKIKGGIDVTERRGRRRRKLLDVIKERRGYSHLKEEALDRSKWRAGFRRALGLS